MLLVFRISKKTKTNAREPEKCWSKETATENVKSRKNLLLEKEAREKKSGCFFFSFFYVKSYIFEMMILCVHASFGAAFFVIRSR